jgi:hypothetical protein
MDDGRRWEGWIEIELLGGGGVLRTPRETVQPNRKDLLYWSSGLSPTLLEGALARAVGAGAGAREPTAAARETEPAGGPVIPASRERGAPRPRAVMDPFHVYLQGEHVLRQELSAMSSAHLQSIADAYELLPDPPIDPASLGRAELVDLIFAAVRRRMRGARP